MERSTRIQNLLSDAVGNGAVPGVAVAAMLASGEVVTAAAGLRNTATGAAMQLVEQGRLAAAGSTERSATISASSA